MKKSKQARVKTVSATLYPNSIAIVKQTQQAYGHRSFSAALDFIINDWANTQSQKEKE